MRVTMSAKLLPVMIAVAATVLTGCATTPYLETNRGDGKPVLGGHCPASAATITAGLRAADRLARHYHGLADRERLGQSIAIGAVVPLGAWASFQGVAERGSKDSIAALGLTGATLYTLGTLYSSSPKQAVYLEGVTSLNCVGAAFAPFSTSADTGLKANIENLLAELSALDQAMVSAPDIADKTRAVQVATNAQLTATEAYRRDATVNSLGAPLCAQVAAIGAAVAREVRKTDPTPGAVLASVKLLPQIAGQIAAPPVTPKVPGPATTDAKFLSNAGFSELDPLFDRFAAAKLNSQIGKVVAAERRLRISLDAGADPLAAIAASKACALPAALNKLVISPDTTALSIVKGGSAEINAEVGVPPAQVSIAGVKAAAVSVDIMVRGSNFGIVIKGVDVTGDTPVPVKISDGSGLISKTIAVTVTPVPPKAE